VCVRAWVRKIVRACVCVCVGGWGVLPGRVCVCMRHVVVSFVTQWLHNIVRHYLINEKIFGKNVTEHKMCVLIFSTVLCETFLIPRRIQLGIGINVKTPSCKIPFILVGF
jgi:hypothetical protein